MMIDFSFRRQQTLGLSHVLAARLRVCAPETAFRLYPTLEMHTWCRSRPGILFPFGTIRFSGEFPRAYHGGICKEGGFFLFVPQTLYLHHLRTLLWELAREQLGTTNQALLHAYCKRAEKELHEGDASAANRPVWWAQNRARQVSDWARLLAYRQERMTAGWRW